MKLFFRHWHDIEKQLSRRKKHLLLFDFDGTLSPIKADPKDVFLSAPIKRLLNRLVRLTNCHVGVVSGRALSDLKKRVSIKGLYLGGNHGIEACGPNFRFIHSQSGKWKKKLNLFLSYLSKAIKNIEGVWVENKKYTASIHYRCASKKTERLLKKKISHIANIAYDHEFNIREGNKVFDVVPCRKWHKGNLVEYLVKRLHVHSLIYVGDDQTDEDVFRIMKEGSLSIRIGHSSHSKAHYYVPAQAAISDILEKLSTLKIID